MNREDIFRIEKLTSEEEYGCCSILWGGEIKVGHGERPRVM